MLFVEIILLSLALCVDSLVVSTASAFKSKMSYRRGLLMAMIFGFFQGLFPLLGALLGSAFKDLIEAVDHWIAFGLLLLIGGKMIFDGLRNAQEDKGLDVTKISVLCLLGIATSIDAFVVGIGMGLANSLQQCVLAAAVIAVVTAIVSLVGLFLGKRQVPIPEKVASVVAGLVLIALGTYTLIEHLLAL